ncbi:MAG: thioredoxin-dependent thiol peroxidase [Dehalococcoidia bacterium]|nr:thioredoxin-dependent thiol peroxidase [Dehalococcoidia bacterium]
MSLNIGDKAPEFVLPASTGEDISLKDQAGKKVVLYFYPKDDTPGCTKEACGFRDASDELQALGAVVLGVSADSVKSHEKFVGKYELNFPLLADTEKVVANSYGAWGEKQRYGRTYMGMNRMTYLIDESGNIERIWPAVKADGHATEVVAAIKGA